MTTQKSSLRDQVFQKLRSDILSGRYQPGDELVESTVGKELGVSRTPVREAIRQLELEGLVHLIPNKGTIVNGISAKDVRDIYSIRSKLEGLCAGWAAKYHTEEELEQLEETVYLSKYHAQKEHYEQVFELDSRFHEILYEASHSKILAHTLSDFHQYVQKARKLSITSRVRSKKSNEEHEMILEAVRAGDEKRAEELATQHILNTISNLEQCGIEKALTPENNSM
ncbi:GntR family transcriptional regulator [bacterium]|nr:GntR family transcriptional regulator [bacterium]MDY3023432.1 GntR family transcriptional regulator [Oliverpabstia sp.]